MQLKWLFLFLFPISTMAIPPEYLSGAWQIDVTDSAIKTTQNYDNGGNVISTLGDFTNLNTNFGLAYQIKAWHLYGGADLGYSQSNLGVFHRTNTSFHALRIGANYKLSTKKFDFLPIVEGKISIANVDPNADNVLLTDGAHALTAGVWAIYKWGQLTPYGYSGMTYKTSDLASPYDFILGTSFAFSQFQIYGELHNSSIWRNDAYINAPFVRWNVDNNVNAGSYYYYSVNPTYTDLTLGSRITWSQDIATNFGLAYTLSGQRYAQGLSFIFSLSWGFGYSSQVARPIPGTFKEKVEDEDQTLFEK